MTLSDDVLRAVLAYTDRVLLVLEREGAALVVNRAEARVVVSACVLAVLDEVREMIQ